MPMSMRSVGAKIVRLANDFPHTEGLPGFYALVYHARELPTCDECESPLDITWDICGHGWSVTEALENAHTLATTGKPLKTYEPEDFCETSDAEPAPTPQSLK
jgi:hypothetical protein